MLYECYPSDSHIVHYLSTLRLLGKYRSRLFIIWLYKMKEGCMGLASVGSS